MPAQVLAPRQIAIAEYLYTRLRELGVGSVHGVPGDYGIVALDYVYKAGLHWVGNANELCAGYAADGYARTKGISVLTTSFGVGELSAINAIGGAYAEKSPVVHIVGTPPTFAQNAKACLHHSLGDGDFRVYAEMGRRLSVASANLTNPETAPKLIDATLRECVLKSGPVYIELPSDMTTKQVDEPTSAIDLSINEDASSEDEITKQLLERMYNSKQPLIFVDGFTHRYNVREEVNEFVRMTGIPTLSTTSGNSIVNHSYRNNYGVYAGIVGNSAVTEWVNNCDLVLRLGPIKSDVNTVLGTAVPKPDVTILLEKNCVSFSGAGDVSAEGQIISLKSVLRKVMKKLDQARIPKTAPFPEANDDLKALIKTLPPLKDDESVTQKSFWHHMSSFIQSGDMLLTEAGTALGGVNDLLLPDGATLFASTVWVSIGQALGASQGVSLAQREMTRDGQCSHGRTIVITGDGALQMTAQSISDMIRNRLDVTIIIVNNNGYTVERLVHGEKASYNDIQPWRYLEAPSYFGAPKDDPSYPVRTKQVRTWGDMNLVFQDNGFREGKGLNMIEVMFGEMEAPKAMETLTGMVRDRNKGPSQQSKA